MGHADARRKKVEMGLARDLPEFNTRKVQALQWMVRFGFSTSKILNQLFLSKDDLAAMDKLGLVHTFQIGFQKTNDSRPRPTTIWYPSRRGRVLGKVNKEYLGKEHPSIHLASHDLICQAFCCHELQGKYGGFARCPDFGVRPARMLQKLGLPGLDLKGHLPDAIFGVRGKLGVVEVERNPVLKKRGEGRLLDQFKLLEKMNHLVFELGLELTMLYMTQKQADDNWELCGSAAAYGYPSFVKGENGHYWPDKTWVNGVWQQDKKPLLFPVDDVRFLSLDSIDLSRWLPC